MCYSKILDENDFAGNTAHASLFNFFSFGFELDVGLGLNICDSKLTPKS